MIRQGDRQPVGHIDAMWTLNGAKCRPSYSVLQRDVMYINPQSTLQCICSCRIYVINIKDYVRFSRYFVHDLNLIVPRAYVCIKPLHL